MSNESKTFEKHQRFRPVTPVPQQEIDCEEADRIGTALLNNMAVDDSFLATRIQHLSTCKRCRDMA